MAGKRHLGWFAAVAIVLAGCTADPVDDGPRTAPPVAHPVDTKTFAQYPCDSLSQAQQSKLQFITSSPHQPASCSFYRDSHSSAAVTYQPSDGLAKLYNQKAAADRWEPLQLNGFPAVVHQAKPADDHSSTCDATVGTAGKSSFTVEYFIVDNRDNADTCALARTVAGEVLGTITSLPKAPKVAKPLNASVFFAKPCATLDAAGRKALGLDDGLNRPPRECDQLHNDADSVSLTYSRTDGGGLGAWYARPLSPERKPTDVAGYPALTMSSPSSCTVVVGLADTADFTVGFGYSDHTKTDACDQALAITKAVLTVVQKIPPGKTAPPPPRAPKVATPLPADAFRDKPCTSLDEAGRKPLHLDAGADKTTGPSHIACDYGDGKDLDVEVSYVDDPQGLSALYELHHYEDLDVTRDWQTFDVGGYPAVSYSGSACTVAVALTDTRYYTVRAADLKAARPQCPQAKQVAQAVLTTIKG